jgi:anti-anti-sigma factor
MALTVDVIESESYHLLVLSGDVDTNTAPSLLEVLTSLSLPAINELRIDMISVGFVSSAGLRALIFAKQKMPYDSRLILVGTNADIADVIAKTGLSQAMLLAPDHDTIE